MNKNIMRPREDIEGVIEKYSDTIFRIALSHTKNNAASEDILQDVLIKYMMNITDFHGDEHKKAWLIRVTINECNKLFRTLWYTRGITLEDIYPFCDPQKHEVFYAIMDLPKKYRLIIHLHYYEDMPVKEISEVLGMKENTVLSILHRGRKMLRTILEVEYEYKPV